MSKLDRIPQWLSGWFVVPFVAQLWAAPIQIFHFNTFALYSILANMLVIPFVGIISFCGFIGSIFSLIPTVGEKLCFLTDKIAEPLINALLFISEQASDLPNSLLDIGKPLIIELVLFYILIVALIFAIQKEFESKPRNIAVIALTFALIIFPLFSKLNNKLSFLFFDVGEGDGILISTPNNKLIMVDTGSFERYGYNAAITAIIPYLKDQGIKKLDAIILSHPDSDHIGGTVNLLKNFNTKIIYTNGDSSTTKTYKALEQYIKTNNIQTKIVSNNQKLQIDDAVEITAYKPTNTEDDTFNDTSIVLLIKYKDFAALLTGDSESLAFEQYKDKIIPVNILKVGHHGSYGCLNNKMLDTLKPQISVISVGKNNKHNHPNPQVIKLLNKTNTYTARTDSDNAIKIDTNGKNIQLMKFDTDIQRWKKVRFLK